MAVIELGEIAPPADDLYVPLNRPLIRRLALVVVVAVLVLAGLDGSARPQTHGLRPLWSAPFDPSGTMWLTPDAVYFNSPPDQNAALKAYDLTTGRLRWTSAPADAFVVGPPENAGDRLLLPADRADVDQKVAGKVVGSIEFARATVAIDAATGRPVWRATGDVQSVDGDLALAGDYDAGGQNLAALRLLRLSDGRTIWNLPTPGLRSWTTAYTAGRPDRLVTGDDRGNIKIFSYADGRLLRTGHVPWTTGSPAPGYYTDMRVVGDRLVINQVSPHADETTAYRLDDLGEIWHVDGTSGDIANCKPVLCVFGESAIVGRDLQTGRELWRLTGQLDGFPVGPDRLLAESSDGDETMFQIVEARTGRLIGPPAHGKPATGETLPEASLLLMRPTAKPPVRTAVVNFDLTTGEQSLLGTIDPPDNFGCRSVPGYLACDHDGEVQISKVAVTGGG